MINDLYNTAWRARQESRPSAVAWLNILFSKICVDLWKNPTTSCGAPGCRSMIPARGRLLVAGVRSPKVNVARRQGGCGPSIDAWPLF